MERKREKEREKGDEDQSDMLQKKRKKKSKNLFFLSQLTKIFFQKATPSLFCPTRANTRRSSSNGLCAPPRSA
jgi:hypothetical protein